MCIICVDFQKELLTVTEVRRILTEVFPEMETEHLEEIYEMLEEAEESKDN